MAEDILVVTPQDWIEVPSVAGVIAENFLESEVADSISSNGPYDLLTRFVDEAMLLPAGQNVLNARMLKEGSLLRVWVRLG